MLLLQAVYNSRGPATAIGSGLDVIVGINGIKRNSAEYSTVSVTVGGTAGAQIPSGVVQDTNGYNWSLPSPTIIGSDGTAIVTSTCQTAGAITANPGDITTIVTPQLGWTSVTNTVAATVGTSAESNAALRARQAISTAQPSQSMVEALKGALAKIAGVTRYKVYNNSSSSADSNGVPAHSVCCVVEGGSSSDIANAIFVYKGPGCGTYGTTTASVTDSYGETTNINYDVVGYTQIDITYTLKQLAGYTDATTSDIQNAAVSYLNNLGIGTMVYIGGLWVAGASANSDPKNPSLSITQVQAAVHGQALGTTDIPIAFNDAAQGVLTNITVAFA